MKYSFTTPIPAIPPPDASGYTTTTAVPLYWARYGDASEPATLVLHGGPGADHQYLLPQMLRLAERRPLLLYDQRGGGRSRTDDPTPITWRTQVGDLAAVVAELRAAPAIVGYSWGGLLAALYAIESATSKSGQRPGRLVLIDPAPVSRGVRAEFEAEFDRRENAPAVQRLRDELARSDLKERDPAAYRQRAFAISVAGYFADPLRARDLTPFRVMSRVQQSVWESLGDYDLAAPGQLNAISPPPTTLVVHGRQDPIPLASSKAYARVLHAELVVLEDCGHVPYVEQPDALFRAIEDFLA